MKFDDLRMYEGAAAITVVVLRSLSLPRGHHDGERVVFSSIFWIVLLGTRARAVTSARGRGIGYQSL